MSIGYDIAKRKGADLTGEGTQSNNQEMAKLLGEIWNDRKDELSTATVAEAETIARQEIQVR